MTPIDGTVDEFYAQQQQQPYPEQILQYPRRFQSIHDHSHRRSENQASLLSPEEGSQVAETLCKACYPHGDGLHERDIQRCVYDAEYVVQLSYWRKQRSSDMDLPLTCEGSSTSMMPPGPCPFHPLLREFRVHNVYTWANVPR